MYEAERWLAMTWKGSGGVAFHVAVQTAPESKRFATAPALVRVCYRVILHHHVQIDFGLVMLRTPEWFLAFVGFVVALQVAFEHKTLAADRTAEWFLSSVKYDVLVHSRFSCKRLFTD